MVDVGINPARTKTIADWYAEDIERHSNRSHREHLWSGVNYRQFALYIAGKLDRARSPSPPVNKFAFSVVHHFKETRTPGDEHKTIGEHTTKEYDSESGLASFIQDLNVKSTDGRLVFLRGFPSPDWLRTVGAQHKIDPEFFRSHLDFLQPNHYYDLPHLPSEAQNIIRIPLTTVWTRHIATHPSQVTQLREKEFSLLKKYLKEEPRQIGQSIVRKFSVHNSTHFSLEQSAVICVKNSGSKGWFGLVWLDVGRTLDDGPRGPWLDDISSITATMQSSCHPTLTHRPKVALDRRPSLQSAGSNGPIQPTNLAQSACLLPHQYGQGLNAKIMAQDAMYALSEMFAFSASGERQFLNMMDIQISEIDQDPDMEQRMASLRHSKVLLDAHGSDLKEKLRCIRNRGSPFWPRLEIKPGDDNASQQQVVQQTQTALIEDYEFLLDRAAHLSSRCSEGMQSITNGVMLEEARKALTQNEQIKRLTILAFLFLPLSATTSFFGMNVVEFGTGNQSIWISFVTLAGVIATSLLMLFWERIPRPWRKRRDKPAAYELKPGFRRFDTFSTTNPVRSLTGGGTIV